MKNELIFLLLLCLAAIAGYRLFCISQRQNRPASAEVKHLAGIQEPAPAYDRELEKYASVCANSAQDYSQFRGEPADKEWHPGRQAPGGPLRPR